MQDQKRNTELRADSMLPPIETGNQWKNKLMSVPIERKVVKKKKASFKTTHQSVDPTVRRQRLEKLNDPYAGEVPALPKFDGSLAYRHF
jgi:hypothetical protein